MPLQVLQSSNINEIISDISPPIHLGADTFGYVNPQISTRTDLTTFATKADLTKTVRGMLISYENTIYDIYLRPL